MELIANFLLQILLAVGAVVFFGLLLALGRRVFCRISGSVGPKILLATGIIGTPVHELSHALMCLIFGHKITEIKLYQNPYKTGDASGAMGYVNHSYNPKNLYHQIGNFFIGIAPILVGSGVLLLLMWLLIPSVFADVFSELEMLGLITFDLFDGAMYADLFSVFGGVFLATFGFGNWSNPLWWVYMILALTIATHMEVSTPDIKSGVKGFLFLAGVLLAVDVVLFFVSVPTLNAVTGALASFSFTVTGFLMISALFSALMILVALLVRGIRKLIKK